MDSIMKYTELLINSIIYGNWFRKCYSVLLPSCTYTADHACICFDCLVWNINILIEVGLCGRKKKWDNVLLLRKQEDAFNACTRSRQGFL